MNVEFDESFAKDLRTIRQQKFLLRIKAVIEEVERAKTPMDIRNLKRLKASGDYYRIRLGNYRLGLVIERGTATFIRCLDRKDIYRFFP